MKTMRLILINLCIGAWVCMSAANDKPLDNSLKQAFERHFLIGAAMNASQINGYDVVGDSLITKHFSSVVAENCMKSEVVQPVEGVFDFSMADKFVNFGEKHRMYIIGHTLIWHSQVPKWFFVNEKGQPVGRELLIERMHAHIAAVVGHFKGRVQGWDVVNEAINDDGSYRESPFYKILGKDFVKLAFQFAHEADPDAQLYYNDYNMAMPGKRQGVVKMISELKAQGIRVDAIGMQGHLSMDFPALDEFEKSILAFASLGTKVSITELDLSVLPSPWVRAGANVSDRATYQEKMNPYANGMPDSINAAWEKRYFDFFNLFLKQKDKIMRVTLWGVTDGDSWKNNWPIPGRKDYPLLFDRHYQPKPLVKRIIDDALAH